MPCGVLRARGILVVVMSKPPPTSAGQPIVEVCNLAKSFRVPIKEPGFRGALKHLVAPRFEERRAVAGVSLKISAGERVAYIGPNGAGKSTTVKMLSGILAPTSGEIRVAGIEPYRNRMANARNIGVVFGQRSQLWWDLPVRDSYRLLGDIYQVPAQIFREQLEWCVESLELSPLLGQPARALSLGQKMRCDVAAALLHRPPLLFLDEPTIGLDITVKERLRAFIRDDCARFGTTLILTSHDTEDVEALCDRIVIIDKGAVLFDGPREEMLRTFGRRCTLHIVFAHPSAASVALCRDAVASEIVEVTSSGEEGVQIHFHLDQMSVASILSRLLPKVAIKDIRVDETSLQEIISMAYKGRLTNAATVDA